MRSSTLARNLRPKPVVSFFQLRFVVSASARLDVELTSLLLELVPGWDSSMQYLTVKPSTGADYDVQVSYCAFAQLAY